MVTFPGQSLSSRPFAVGLRLPLVVLNGCVLAAAAAYLLIAPKVYESTFAIKVVDSRPRVVANVSEPNIANSEERTLGSDDLDSTQVQREILLSNAVIDRFARKLHILRRDAMGMVEAQSNNRASLLAVTVRGPTPEDARENARLLEQIYLARVIQMRREELTDRRATYAAALENTRQKLARAALALSQARAASGLLDNGTYFQEATRQMLQLDQQRQQAEVQLGNLETQARVLAGRLGTTPAAAVLSLRLSNYAPYRNGRNDLDQVERQLAQQGAKFADTNPKMRTLVEQQRALQALVRARRAEALPHRSAATVDGEVDQTRAGLLAQLLTVEAQAQGVRAQHTRLIAQIADLNRRIRALPAVEQRLNEAHRRLVIAEGVFNHTLAQYQGAQLAEMVARPEVRRFDAPSLPEKPSSPRPLVVLVGAVAVGLLASVSLILWSRQRSSPTGEGWFAAAVDSPAPGTRS